MVSRGKQRGQHQRVPQRRLAYAGFEDRVFVAGVGIGVQQRDRQRTDILQRVFVARLVGFAAAQGEFQIRHVAARSMGFADERRIRFGKTRRIGRA